MNLNAVPRARIADPTTHVGLASFSCGATTEYEREVDDIVESLSKGKLPNVDTLVAEDPTSGDLIGVCGFTQRSIHPAPPDQPDPDEAYVQVIGINESFRGQRLPDGETRVGEWLLRRSLEQIQEKWGGPPMPPVWAMIHPLNQASQQIFRGERFQTFPLGGAGYLAAYRGRGLPLQD